MVPAFFCCDLWPSFLRKVATARLTEDLWNNINKSGRPMVSPTTKILSKVYKEGSNKNKGEFGYLFPLINCLVIVT